jgi:hypothetical protein
VSATSNSALCFSTPSRAHAAWLECGSARFEVRLTSLDSEHCELIAESCCCSRLREGAAVALEVPPPLSGAGLLRLAGRVIRRDEGPTSGALARERLRIEFSALANPQRLALDSTLPSKPSANDSQLRRAA